jgi:NAD+ kinase
MTLTTATTASPVPEAVPEAAAVHPTPRGYPRVAIYGGRFDPPGLHHRRIVEELRRHFDAVVVVPCGPRPDKPIGTEPVHRAALADLAFRGMDGVEVDLFDLEQATFTRTHDLEKRYAGRGELWHVVGSDLVAGGAGGDSSIHRRWEQGPRMWQELRYAVVARRGQHVSPANLPPHSQLLAVEFSGSSFMLRERVFKGEAVNHLTIPPVADFIRRHKLYYGGAPSRAIRYNVRHPRVLIVYDERNKKAAGWAEQFKQYEDREDPNLILAIGGDGTMLHAIQQHWRLRVPFFGLNAGHLGFLLNRPDEVLGKFPPPEIVSRPMPLLYVEMQKADGSWTSGLTFNDAWVERSTGQTAWLDVTVDGKARLTRLICDGLLVSTAAGSTAYARSMGATPLLSDTPAWLLVGSNVMQPVHWKSALLSPEATVEIRSLDPAKRPLNGFLYGVPIGEVTMMRARVSRIATAELAFCSTHDITEKIAQIQFPGEGANFPGL